MSLSEWIMMGIIFVIVVAAPRVGRVGEVIVTALGGKQLARKRMAEQPIVYISDPTAEAARVATALRARGYMVLDVPLALLVSRVAVQVPALVVLDVDADGALEAVARLREGPAGEGLEVLLVGEPGRTLLGTSDAVLAGASGFLPRPVEASLALRKVQSLVPVDSGADSPASSRRAPTSLPPPSGPLVSPAISLHEPGLEPGPWSLGGLTATPRLSDDLQRVLARAEARVASTDRHSSAPPSPEDEVDAVLPPRMLEALDEPLLYSDDRGSWASSTPAQTEGRTEGRTVGGSSAPASSPFPAPPPSGAPGGPSWAPASRLAAPDPEPPSALPLGASPGGADPLGPEGAGPDSLSTGRQPPEVSTRVERLIPSRGSSDIPPSLGRAAEAAPGRPSEVAAVPSAPPGAPTVQATPDAIATIPPPRRTAAVPSFPPLPPLPAELLAPPSEPPSEPPPPGPVTVGPPPRPAVAPPPDHSPPPVPPAAMLPAMVVLPPMGSALPGPPVLTSLPAMTATAPPPLLTPPPMPVAAAAPPAAAPAGAQPAGHAAPPVMPLPAAVLPAGPAAAAGPGALPAMAVPGVAPAAGAARRPEMPAAVVLEEGTALRLLAKAAAERFSGVLCFEAEGGLRRVVVRDGDLVTAGSSLDEESLVVYLEQRGELPREVSRRLQGKLPPFGRHAGAALVANGHLAQDRLWQTLRGHAEWLTGRAMVLAGGVCSYEDEPAGRLRSEPAVFGGSTGAEVLVEVARRVLPPEESLARLGGRKARLGEGKRAALLAECALSAREVELVERSRGFMVGELLEAAPGPDLASVLLTLVALGVLETLAPSEAESEAPPPRDDLDDEALRARVRARLALVEEGDYFAVLAVPRSATPYEIKRAYLDLRRSFEPSRVLSPTTADLLEGLRLILEVLDEAYEVLRDPTRRERYRRAIEARPPEE